jgi:hypothetical protein
MGSVTKTQLSLSATNMRKPFKTILAWILLGLLWHPYLDLSMIRAQSPQQGVTASVEAAREAGIAEDVLNRILTLSVDYRLSSQDVVALLDILRTVRSENLPLQPFVAKIEEGLAKKAATSAIATALLQEIDDYQFVRTLLGGAEAEGAGPAVSDDDLTTLVGSIYSGISREELAHFIERAPSAPPTMVAIAVENLALLKQIGFDPNLTRRMLYSGLRQKRLGPSWRYLARVAAVARNRGISDKTVAEATVKAMAEQGDLKDLMTTLGFTGRDLRHGPTTGRPGRTGQ